MPNVGRKRGPLRKIVEVLRHAESVYAKGKCLLECGHIAYSRGIYQARCRKCIILEEEG